MDYATVPVPFWLLGLPEGYRPSTEAITVGSTPSSRSAFSSSRSKFVVMMTRTKHRQPAEEAPKPGPRGIDRPRDGPQGPGFAQGLADELARGLAVQGGARYRARTRQRGLELVLHALGHAAQDDDAVTDDAWVEIAREDLPEREGREAGRAGRVGEQELVTPVVGTGVTALVPA
jgi:hypothetical protein